MAVPLETVSSATHGADDRNKGQSVLPVYCLDIKPSAALNKECKIQMFENKGIS